MMAMTELMSFPADFFYVNMTGMAIHLSAGKLAAIIIRSFIMALAANSAVITWIAEKTANSGIQQFSGLRRDISGQTGTTLRPLA